MKDRKSFLGTFMPSLKKEKNQSEINDSLPNDSVENNEEIELSEEIENDKSLLDPEESTDEIDSENISEEDLIEEDPIITEEPIMPPENPSLNSEEKEYIEIEDVLKDEDSLMDSLLSDADELLSDGLDETEETTQEQEPSEEDLIEEPFEELNEPSLETQFSKEELDEDKIEDDFEELEEAEEALDEEVSPEFVYTEEDIEVDDSEYYNDSEISAKRNKTSNKNLLLKIVVGIIALAVIAGLAFGIRYLLNNKDNLFNKDKKEEISTEVETSTPTINPTIETTPVPEETQGLDVKNEEKETLEQQKPEKEEVSSFIQTFTGYIVDINNSDIYVSDKITDDQVVLLKNDFEAFNSGTSTTVYVKDLPSEATTSSENTESSSDIVIIGETTPSTDDTTTTEETEKVYHSHQICEMTSNADLQAIDLSELPSDYVPCDSCGEDLETMNTDNNVIDYDYSTVTDLASIIYKKFNIDAENIPAWATIGSQVTISYIQNEETYLNDVIEVSKAKSGTSDASEVTQLDEDGNPIPVSDDDDDYRLSETNIFGADFETIIATINDRKKTSGNRTGSILDEEQSLLSAGTRESVSSKVAIGSCDYVWIQIVWKKNVDTLSIPDLDDVSVELQTPSGSLVNGSNIDSYGKTWINKKVINYVLKNPKAGNWTVLFTKDVGTFLGDVTIQAAPMTGFLQIKKAAAKYTNGTLKCVWQATGVPDDNCKVQIYARNGNNDILLYSGNTIDDDIRTVDMVDIDTTKIAGNIYDIVIKVTDIDVTVSAPKKISYQFITDEFIVENVEVPSKK